METNTFRARPFDISNPAAEYERLKAADEALCDPDDEYYREHVYPWAESDKWHLVRSDWGLIIDQGDDTPIDAYCLILPIRETIYHQARSKNSTFNTELGINGSQIIGRRQEMSMMRSSAPVYYWLVALAYDEYSPDLLGRLFEFLENRLFGVNVGGVFTIASGDDHPVMLWDEAGMRMERIICRPDQSTAVLYSIDAGTAVISRPDDGAIPFFTSIFRTAHLTRHRRHYVGLKLTDQEKHAARRLFSWLLPLHQDEELKCDVFMSKREYADEYLKDKRNSDQATRTIVEKIEAKVQALGFPVHNDSKLQSLVSFFTLYPGELD